MHEASVICNIVNAILQELKDHEVISVESVTLRIGRLTNLGFDQMSFAYEVVTRDTVLEGSKLLVEEEPIILKCDSCGYEGPAKNMSFGDEVDDEFVIPVLSCPECGGSVKVISGQSCCVKCIDLEEGR